MKFHPVKCLLALSLLCGLAAMNACQKDGINPRSSTAADNPVTAGDRSPGGITYGVTVFDGVNPCDIVGIDEATGAILSLANATYVDPNNVTINLDNLKGICLTSWGQYFLTTGAPASTTLGASIYDNSLYKVDPVTGQCSYFGSVCPFGTVSDLEFDPNTQTFFGLRNNSNAIMEIQLDANGNYTVYTPPAAIFGIQNRSLSGLSLVRDQTGMYLVGAATRPGVDAFGAQLYTVPAGGGLAGLMTELTPQVDFAGGHCGIGFDLDLNHLAVNRTTTTTSVIPGLSEVNPWNPPPLPLTIPTNNWTALGFNFEDLTSSVY